MANRYEHEIPEGYAARIEGNKVVIEKKAINAEEIRKDLVSHILCGTERKFNNTETGAWLGTIGDGTTRCWVARDTDGKLGVYLEKPHWSDDQWLGKFAFFIPTSFDRLPEITAGSEPVEIYVSIFNAWIR